MQGDGSEPHEELIEAIDHLTNALEAARQAPGQSMLVKLIEAILLHAGIELARLTQANRDRI